MRRLKTYFRSTMSTKCLNSVMTLHVHKDLLDGIDDSAVVKDFVACNEVRKDIFGKGVNLPAPVGHPMTKMLSASGGLHPLTRGSAPVPCWGLCLQTPVIDSCSALAMVPRPQPLTPSAAYVCVPTFHEVQDISTTCHHCDVIQVESLRITPIGYRVACTLHLTSLHYGATCP